jgi:actin-like protein 6A
VSEIFAKCKDESLANSIVVCGGTANLQNYAERLSNDLNDQRMTNGKSIRTIAAPVPAERRHSAWLGGSVVASLSSFSGLWVSRAEFEDHGACVIGKKCP